MGGEAMTIAAAILDGARALVSQLLDLVDVEQARALLDAEAVRRANLAADVAELAKFDPVTGEPRR